MRKHYTAAQRAELTNRVASGRATPRAASAQMGVPESTAYYWLRGSGQRATAVAFVPRRARPGEPERPPHPPGTPPPFARLVRAADGPSPITLRVGGVILDVRPGFDPALLRQHTHAEAAAAIFSVIASCRLHGLDPFQYLDEILRVLPYWPSDRYLELSPKYWRATRERLRPKELERPISAFEVRPPLGAAVASVDAASVSASL